jgi:hypothetical protein
MDYVAGVSDYNAAQATWGKCRALYLKYGQIEAAPSELTDKKSIVTYADAKNYLDVWLAWMGKRRTSFSVAYLTGHTWNLADIITINLPHITDANAIKCKIEKISKNKTGNSVKVNLIIMDDLEINTGVIMYQEKAGAVSAQLAEQAADQSTQLAEVD